MLYPRLIEFIILKSFPHMIISTVAINKEIHKEINLVTEFFWLIFFFLELKSCSNMQANTYNTLDKVAFIYFYTSYIGMLTAFKSREPLCKYWIWDPDTITWRTSLCSIDCAVKYNTMCQNNYLLHIPRRCVYMHVDAHEAWWFMGVNTTVIESGWLTSAHSTTET